MVKEFLSSLIWGAVLFVIQVAVDLVKHEPIDWQTAILASVILVAIHFFVSRGRTTIEDTNKKTGANKTVKKNISQKAKGKIDNSKGKKQAEPTEMEKRGYNAEDLKFYLYHRNSKLSLIAGIVCILIWYLNSSAWFLYVGIAFILLGGVYYIFFILKRKMFVEKQRKELEEKKKK